MKTINLMGGRGRGLEGPSPPGALERTPTKTVVGGFGGLMFFLSTNLHHALKKNDDENNQSDRWEGAGALRAPAPQGHWREPQPKL